MGSNSASTISRAYATSAVTGAGNVVDGLVGDSQDIAIAGGSSSVWRIYEGQTAPLLRSFLTALTVAGNASATYNGGTQFAITPVLGISGLVQYQTSSKNVGTYSGSDLILYSDQQGYDINWAGGTLTVDQAQLSVSTSAVMKTYDGGLMAAGTATVTGGTLFGSDAISGGTFAFTDKNVGAGNKTVTTSGVTVADGNGGGNYNVSYADNTTSSIDPYAISLTGSRVYDGDTDVEATALSLGTLVGSETLGLAGTGTVADKHVANAKTVTLGTLVLSDGTNGGVASNYTFTGSTQTTDITQAALTLSTSDVSKVYDGNTTASGTATVTSGPLFIGDSISGGSFAYADQNAGAGNKTVTTSGVAVADGNGGANYNISYVDNTSSSISPKALSVSGMLAADKAFDGNTAATLSGGTLVGLVGTETLALSGQSGAFADSSVGTDKDVSVVGIVLSDGSGLAANYCVSDPQGLTADITPIDTAPASDGIDTRLTSAITTAVSINSSDAWASDSDGSDSPSGKTSDPNTTGLNLTIAGDGLRLPDNVEL